MVAEVPSVRQRKSSSGFVNQLSSAFCEWFLIFLLFVDAALSYFLTRFANYYELKTPCLLCTRLDYIFGKKKQGCLWSLLCNKHREEISSFASCSIHGKLADVKSMCEECLTPIALQNKSSTESYRLLVGKLWVDVEKTVLHNLFLNKQIQLGSSVRRTCSCCNKIWRNKSNADRLLELTGIGFGASKANMKPPLPRAPGRSRFSRRDSLKRLRDKFTGTSKRDNADKLFHVGYTKLKISSDSESEFLPSEDDDEGNASSCDKNYESDGKFRRRRGKSVDSGVPWTKQGQEIHEVKKPVTVDQPNLVDLSEQNTVGSASFDPFVDHGLRELNWEESYSKRKPCSTEDLISLGESTKQHEDVGGSSVEMISQANASRPHMNAITVLSELLSLYNDPSFSHPNKKINVVEKGKTFTPKNTEAVPETSSVIPCPMEPNNTNSTEASSENIQNTESSKPVVETNNILISAKTEEDMKPVAEVSNLKTEGDMKPVAEVSNLNNDEETNTRAQVKHELSKKEDDTRTQDIGTLTSLKRNDLSCESLDGMSMTDVEGESTVDRLRRQVEHDRSTMSSLYKELEEERNAAAVAANEAMAMITRLQEEKAALHMEALQYLRMMEEQAEYDMEALERANDLLAEKEKELQDVEMELEFFRSNFVQETEVKDIKRETKDVKTSDAVSNDPKSVKLSKVNVECRPIDSLVSNFEDEKKYISQCLKNLEKKLHRPSFSGRLRNDLPNGLHSENNKISVFNPEDSHPDKETISIKHNGDNKLNGTPAHDTQSDGAPIHDSKNDHLYEKKDKLSAKEGETELSIFEKEIATLQDRLEALEIERDVLKHTSNLLPNGIDGIHFIQEIAHQLQVLRQIGFEKR